MTYPELASMGKAELLKQQCECVSCNDCGGSGNIWLDFRGHYLGPRRSDDGDEMIPCDSCHGGIIETCDRCRLLDEFEQDQDFEWRRES